jgi:ribosomal protein S18 acetylase RimI-like enzyme
MIKHPVVTDIDQVFQFMIACDIEEYGEGDSSREDLEEQWSEIDLSQDVWVAYNEMQDMIGYANVNGRNGKYWQEIYSHGKLTPIGMEDELAVLCQNRVKELLDLNGEKQAKLKGYVTGVNQRMQQVYEKHGFIKQFYQYRMQIDFTQAYEPPLWPENFVLSAFKPEDENELYQLIQSTFDWEGRSGMSLESWRNLIFRGGRYDPECFVMVRYGGRLVAAALTYAEDANGWIRQLAVAKGYQGKGLGGKLLRYMFHFFYSKGLPRVGLAVASTNINACQFYERNGMRKTREHIEYCKDIE